MTRVIAHRGASGHRPENTLAAYALAVEQRADMIEIDLHRTRDGAVVITHDGALPGLGEVADASLAEVRALDAGEGQQVPLLDEVLDAFGAVLPFNLELKTSPRGPYPGLAALAVEAAESRGILSRTLFSAFSDAVLAELRQCGPTAPLGVLVSPRDPSGWLARAERVQAVAVNLHTRLATPDAIASAHAAGLEVNVYTVDEPRTLARLVGERVDGIFTNYPDRLRNLIDESNRAGARAGPKPVR